MDLSRKFWIRILIYLRLLDSLIFKKSNEIFRDTDLEYTFKKLYLVIKRYIRKWFQNILIIPILNH